MDGQVCPIVFLLLGHAQPHGELEHAINHHAAEQRPDNAHRGANQLRTEGDATQPAQCFAAKNTRSKSAPSAAQTMQGPDAQHVVNLPFVLR